MAIHLKLFSALVLSMLSLTAYCQTDNSTKGVAIGTSDIAPGSALQIESNSGGLVQPRMTTAEMNAIPTPLDGAFIFNTTENNWFIRKDGVWQSFVRIETPSVILNRGQTNNAFIITNTNTITSFPLNQNNALSTNDQFYSLSENNGEIGILRSGTYLISAGFSTTSLPAGSISYRLEVSVNNSNTSIITNGQVNLPSSDYWGSSGNIILILQAGDTISLGYILKSNSSYSRTAAFFNIGISKL